MKYRLLIAPMIAGIILLLHGANAETRQFYQTPAWQPRALLPADDALRGDFWPPSPPVTVDYTDPTFDDSRLGKVPPPGVHPRVMITPDELDRIRQKIAMGDRAPLAFRCIWERVKRTQSAFYALAMKDDAMGEQLAAAFMVKMHSLDKKLDALDKRPDHDNLWIAMKSMAAANDPNNPAEIADVIDYDYLFNWLTPEDQAFARHVIAHITDHRISNFMMVPDHFMVNNHEGFGMEFMKWILLIEGEKGFDQQVYNLAAQKMRAFLSYDLDNDGIAYETVKGWLNSSAFYALAHRQRDLLKHSHLQAKMRFFAASARWEDGAWRLRDEMRASAFHVVWMMHAVHPSDLNIDFLYKASLNTHPFITDPNAHWDNPVGIDYELLALFADDGMVDASGKPLDWSDQKQIEKVDRPLTFQDNQRGYLDARNTWKKADLHVTFDCKQDFFYNGHEGSEHGRFTLWADGVNWARDVNQLFNKAAWTQNELSVDGRGTHWPPVAGKWLGVIDTPEAVCAIGDDKDGYSYTKVSQVHELDWPSAQLPYYAPFTAGNFTFTRDQQMPFTDQVVAFNDGFAHTDYGPWSGESRLTEYYRPFNPMRRAFRTLELSRGPHPYVLICDDAQKDDQPHQYDWNMTLPDDVQLIDSKISEITGYILEPTPGGITDLLLGTRPRWNADRTQFYQPKYTPKTGDPMLLVRVLNRNTDYAFPPPRVEQSGIFNRLVVPAHGISPDFRIMLYPHLQGDPIPLTRWSDDRSQLTVKFDGQTDVYTFAKTDAGRTVFALERNGKIVQTSNAPPPRPQIIVREEVFDASDRRYRRDDHPPTYLLDRDVAVTLVSQGAPGGEIHYTLDGSDPIQASPTYSAPFTISQSCQFKARFFDDAWRCGPSTSEVLSASFEQRSPAQPANLAAAAAAAKFDPSVASPGLLARVYEMKTVVFNDRGFFDGSKIMMPDVSKLTPLLTTTMPAFATPLAVPAQPMKLQTKGFYRFTGYFNAPSRGIYQFAVDSCGPVTLDIAGQTAIEVIGQYHLEQDVRRGEVALDAGWHPIELVVCDPQFWNVNSLAPMPLSVKYRIDGAELRDVGAGQLCYVPEPGQIITPQPQPLAIDPASESTLLERGLDLSVYAEAGKNHDPDYLDIDAQTPIRKMPVNELTASGSAGMVNVYDGFFRATEAGVYTFDLPVRSDIPLLSGSPESSILSLNAVGELTTEPVAFADQLRLSGNILVQHGVPGRNPLSQVLLKPGIYPISIRLGNSRGQMLVRYPDGSPHLLGAEDLFRPLRVRIASVPSGDCNDGEILAPTHFLLFLPPLMDQSASALTIHYTLDGTEPNSNSPKFDQPINIAQTTTITAKALEGDTAKTALTQLQINRVDEPEAGLVCQIDCDKLDAANVRSTAPIPCRAWLSSNASIVDGSGRRAIQFAKLGDGRKDPNVTPGAGMGGLSLADLKLLDNAITVSLWIKPSGTTGKIFGKEGFNAFGKSYKAVSCDLSNGSVSVEPGHLRGGKLATGQWSHIVLTGGDDGLDLFINGQLVKSTEDRQDVVTDALDICPSLAGMVRGVRIYNRVLTAGQVMSIYQQEK